MLDENTAADLGTAVLERNDDCYQENTIAVYVSAIRLPLRLHIDDRAFASSCEPLWDVYHVTTHGILRRAGEF
jgi:hypothetical protein